MDTFVYPAEEVGMSAAQLSLIRERGAAWCDGVVHSAMTLLVARRGKIVLLEAFGRQSSDSSAAPAQVDNLYPLTSISKFIVATGIMLLVDRGLVGLHRKVNSYIPEFEGPGKDSVLVYHLLNHTSGIDEGILERFMAAKAGSDDALHNAPLEALTRTYLELGYDGPLACPPGQRHYYANYNYELLGELITRVTGQPFQDFIQEQVFIPLGMKHTWFELPDSSLEKVIRRPDWARFASPADPNFELMPKLTRPVLLTERDTVRKVAWASAGCYATAGDMFRLGQMMLNRGQLDGRPVLSAAAVSTMTRNQTVGIGVYAGDQLVAADSNYGYGCYIYGNSKNLKSPSLISAETFGHSGAAGCDITIDPFHELITIYFSTELLQGPLDQHNWYKDLFVNMAVAAIMA